MRLNNRQIAVIICLLITSLSLFSCEKKKEGKIIVTEKEFFASQFSEKGWSINAKGKIKNVGDVDVQDVVVTGVCNSCSEVWVAGKWNSSPEMEKTQDQKSTINYINTGTEEEFSFKDVALLYTKAPNQKPEIPGQLDIVIESYETVD